ncbi:MAG TPA: DUF924 family protein [Casimicrobiaceae bacterium]|nr:DUF924 family protein [Casimicrobiaceae bacterium]
MHDAILDFWFGRPGTAEYGTTRDFWFRKDPAFDAELRARFGAAVENALAGDFEDWSAPRPELARIVLLDQLTRNIFRDTSRAFAGDALALRLAREATERGDDRALIAVERWFAYMPFVHAESTVAQERSVELFRRLRDETGLAEPLKWAQKHAEVVRRFGRFPHRNASLGRASTAEELAFLAAPGSRF